MTDTWHERPAVSTLFLALGLSAVASAQEPEEGRSERIEVVLQMPFVAGESQNVWLAPGEGSHQDRFNRHAVDFSPLVEGHLIVAAAPGRVVFVKEDTEGPTGDWRDNNEVAVEMPSGSEIVVYLHLQKDGALVSVGDEVLPGDPIGRAGNTGSSSDTHLHIDVRKGHRIGPSVPWRFAELGLGAVPETGRSIRSENRPMRARLAVWDAKERLVGLLGPLNALELITADLRRDLDAVARVGGAGSASETDFAESLFEQEVAACCARLREDLARREEAAWEDCEAAVDDPQRAENCLRLIASFPGSESATRAEEQLEAMDKTVVRAARRRVTAQWRRWQSLAKAVELELALVRDGQFPPFTGRSITALEKAYAKAFGSAPDELEVLLDPYLERLRGGSAMERRPRSGAGRR